MSYVQHKYNKCHRISRIENNHVGQHDLESAWKEHYPIGPGKVGRKSYRHTVGEKNNFPVPKELIELEILYLIRVK